MAGVSDEEAPQESFTVRGHASTAVSSNAGCCFHMHTNTTHTVLAHAHQDRFIRLTEILVLISSALLLACVIPSVVKVW